MIQLAVQANNGEPGARRYLDLYETQPIKLTLSIEDITTTDTTAVYSQTFRIPATGNNSQFFVTAFDINGFDFDISQKQSAELIVDGDIYQAGEIRLLKVFIDEQSNAVDYELLFLGTTRSFASSVGETNLCELDLSALSHTTTSANILTSWLAYPQGGLTDGLLDGDVIYPLVNFGNSYDDNFDPDQTLIRNGGSADNFTQNNTNGRLNVDRLRPCVRAKYIWDTIFANSGFTYESTFLDSNLFRHLYIGAWGDSAQVILNQFLTAGNDTNDGVNLSAETTIDLNIQQSEGYDLGNNWFEVNSTGLYDITARVPISSTFTDLGDPTPHNATYRLRIKKLSGVITTTLASVDEFTEYTLGVGGSGGTFIIMNEFVNNASLLAGDKVFLTLELISSNELGGASIEGQGLASPLISITQEASNNPGIALSCNYLQIDFIKDIITKFRLVMAPDRNIPNKFIIEPWSEYIGSGDQLDWTDKMDLSKDIQVEPILYTQKEKIKFEDKQAEDFLSVLNENDFGEVYGTLNYDSQSPLLKDERKIKTKFEPLTSIQIDGANQNATNAGDNFIIPLIHDHETEINSSNNAVILYLPCKPGTRLFWYDGLKETGTSLAKNITWYLTDGTTNTAHSNFPMISQFSEWGDYTDTFQGLDTQTQDLNWQRENTFIRFGLANPALGNSVYDLYWSRYTNLLYDPYSRRITMYLKLDKFDLINFSFDDAIFLKNGWYYVEKINSVDLEADTSVKVELIRLRDFSVLPKSFIPPSGLPQNWEDVDDEWQLITDNWEAV